MICGRLDRYTILFFLFLIGIGTINLYGQQPASKMLVSGVVVDAKSGTPLDLAYVIIEGTSQGVSTDQNGHFSITTDRKNISLKISRLGYSDANIKVLNNKSENLRIELVPVDIELNTVVVKANKIKYKNKNNPAVSLIDSVVAYRDKNRVASFDYLQYEKYEKIQFALSNVSEDFKKSAVLKDISFIFENPDTTKQAGKEVLPMYIKETLSDYYYRKTPKAENTIVKADKMANFEGYLDNKGISAYLNHLYQDIDIYSPNITFLTNQFLSPIANTAPLFYRYYIQDTLDIDGTKCIKLFFSPRNKTDMLFQGFMYITMDGSYAVKRIDMGVNKNINLNWVKDVNIAQEFVKTVDEGWVKSLDELSVDFGFNQRGMGIFGQRSVSYRNFVINLPIDDSKFKRILPVADSINKSDEFWQMNRHIQLSKAEEATYYNLDSIQKVPSFRTMMDVMRLAFAGFHDFGKFEIGPVSTFASYNSIEGPRVKFGGRTTPKLFNKLILEGYLAYGFKDEQFKYNIGAAYSLTRNTVYDFPVKSLRVNYQVDTKVPGQELYYVQEGNALLSFKRGVDDKRFYNKTFKAEFLDEFENHFSYTLGYNYTRQSPGGVLDFKPLDISELSLRLRYAPKEQFYQGKMFREIVPSRYPIITLDYINSSKFLGGDYNYNSVKLNFFKMFYPGIIGYTAVRIEGGAVFGEVPYPLLQIHNANQTYYYQSIAYNLMNFLEFVSDRYASINIDHCFNGFIFNKIPLIKNLRLREVVTLKVLYGGLSRDNNPDFNSSLMKFPVNKKGITTTFPLENKPYVEVGCAVANILNFVRIDFIQRVSYLNHPNVARSGVRIMFKFDI